MPLTILEGSTFCICDERGDIDAETQGFFAADTRFLSLLRLTLNGAKPLLLSSGVVEYFSAAFYLRNPLAGGLPQDSLSITRERFVGEGMQDRIVVQNQGMEPLAELQAREDDPNLDAEPGKIIHELRAGKAAQHWFRAYYGTVDATPLYLVLLSEVWRWTDDAALLRELKEPALKALAWIDEYGDRDGDGFVEYERRTPQGLENQSWKDSGDSQRFQDGSLAHAPIAPCEVQGYVFDAKLRTAELAREVWRDRALAERLEQEAAELRRAFNERFWTDARGGYYVLALDGEKQQVDSLCSNVGHLLWSGIVPRER